MLCCVGFLSVSSRAYAYTAEDSFYPVITTDAHLDLYDSSDKVIWWGVPTVSNGKYYYNNPDTDGIYSIRWWQDFGVSTEWTFPYNPDVYEYYCLGTMTSSEISMEGNKSTFKPTNIEISYRDYTNQENVPYNISNLNIYNIDTVGYAGFGFSAKVDFEAADCSSLHYIWFDSDKDGSGSKAANLVFEVGIMAVPKGTLESEINQRILNQLQNMENSLNNSIGSAADQVTDAIENQYGMTPGESFGVPELTSQVEEKLGVLSFGADTLNNFLGLFQASNAGSTVLTFPGFTIDVQGESYQVWNDMQFDLAFLEENFGILITAVRTVTVLCVWLAVLGYLVKAYEHLINNKG